jgi:hypothetical protein
MLQSYDEHSGGKSELMYFFLGLPDDHHNGFATFLGKKDLETPFCGGWICPVEVVPRRKFDLKINYGAGILARIIQLPNFCLGVH